MTKYWLIVLFVVSACIGLPTVQAARSNGAEHIPEVSIHKEWVITLNSKKIKKEDVKIELLDRKGKKLDILVEKQEEKLFVKPITPYEYGESYSLRANIMSAQRKKWVQIDFTTEQKKIEDPIVLARIADIKAHYEQWKPVYTGDVYAEKPLINPPYSAGKLHEAPLLDALNTTKLIRYIANLPTTIQLSERFNEQAQAAALISAISAGLSHYPEKPPSMDTTLYDLAYKGASTSNLSKGYNNLVSSIIAGYMNDGDASNIDRVGHRLWILSPKLGDIGFGLVAEGDNSRTMGSAMKIFGDNMLTHNDAQYDYISWPAEKAMPTNYFGANYPWSLSLNPAIYDVNKIENIEVMVTRVDDQQTWRFSQQKADGYFNVSRNSFGSLSYTIIFRPENREGNSLSYLKYTHGDRYKVEVNNIWYKDGGRATIDFDTTFFTLK